MWKILQVAMPGIAHEKKGIPCQDRTYHMHRNNVDVIALSDGAGYSKISQLGADSIVRSISNIICDSFERYLVCGEDSFVKQEIIENVQQELRLVTLENDCTIVDLAGTLLFVAVSNNDYIIGHIGDGVIGCLRNNNLEVLSNPQNGEFVNTTFFVTSADAIETFDLLMGPVESIDGFFLFSDGLGQSFYNKNSGRIAPAMYNIMKNMKNMDIEELHGIVVSDFYGVVREKTLDDCSLICMVNV